MLRPGGRMGVSDVVADDDLTPAERASRGSFAGCIAGALSFSEYRAGLEAVGLTDVELVPTHAAADGIHSVIVRAVKPADWTPDRIRAVDLPRPVAVRPCSTSPDAAAGRAAAEEHAVAASDACR